MKVSELIGHLKKFDGDCEVMLSEGNILTDVAPIAAIVSSLRVSEEVRKEVVLTFVRREQPAQLWPWVETPSTPGTSPLPYTPPYPQELGTERTTATNRHTKMTVSGLIAKLQRVDLDMTVYVRAWSEPSDGCNIQVVSYADDVWIYHGEHDDQLYIGQANEGTETL